MPFRSSSGPLYQNEVKLYGFLFSCKYNSFSQEKLSTWPHFESEGFWNSEITYCSQTFPRPSSPPPALWRVFSGEGKDKRPLADLVTSEVFFANDLRLNFFNACYQWLNVSLDACMIFVRREHQRHSPAILFTSPKTACFVDVLGTSRPIIPRE